MPAKAGIQGKCALLGPWTPAFAGVTTETYIILLEPRLQSPLLVPNLVTIAAHGQTLVSHPGKAGGLPLFWLKAVS